MSLVLNHSRATKGLKKRRTCMLEYPTDILLLKYHVAQNKVHFHPLLVMGDEGMSIYPLSHVTIPPMSKISIPTDIKLAIIKGHVATVSSTVNYSPCEPLVCSGIQDPAFAEKLVLLVGNLTNKPLTVDPKLPITFIHLLSVNNIVGIAPFRFLRDSVLPDMPSILLSLPLK